MGGNLRLGRGEAVQTVWRRWSAAAALTIACLAWGAGTAASAAQAPVQGGAIAFVSARVGFVLLDRQPPPGPQRAPHLSLYRTDDGGRSWRMVGGGVSPLPNGTVQALALTFMGPQRGYLLLSLGASACQAELAVLATTDGGRTWRRLGGIIPATDGASTIAAWRGRPVVLNAACGAPGLVLDTFRLRRWRSTALAVPAALRGGDATASAIWAGPGRHGLEVAAAYQGPSARRPVLVRLSAAAGTSRWRFSVLPMGHLAAGLWMQALAFAGPRAGVAASAPGRLLATVDGGATWRQGRALPLRYVDAARAAMVAPSIAFVLLTGRLGAALWRTANGGATWRPLPLPA